MEESKKKGTVCVIGGTGFVGPCLVKRLLEDGYSVNTTIRNPDGKRDICYLTNLPGASESLKVFDADFDRPDSFTAAIQGCIGVFHVAHPMEIKKEETEMVNKAKKGTIGILQACVNSKTVKRVVYTSSLFTVAFSNSKDGATSEQKDESCWTDVEYIRSLNLDLGSYIVSKTLTEKAALKFAKENELDLVTVIPPLIHGAFICPDCPISVGVAMALVFANESHYPPGKGMNIVDVEDLVRAHIHLHEDPKAKGRYICSRTDVKIDNKLYEFLHNRYPEYKLPIPDSGKDIKPSEESKKLLATVSLYKNALKTMQRELPSVDISSKRLLETGFQYKKGLKEMFDEAIDSWKKRDLP